MPRARSIVSSPARSRALATRRKRARTSRRGPAIRCAGPSSTSHLSHFSEVSRPMQLGDHPDLALLTGAQMRAAEQAAFARGLPSFEAMRRAGIAVADAIIARWPASGCSAVHVLCGPGNNGGDGFVVAATLRAAGYRVSVQSVRAKPDYAGDAARAAALWQGDVEQLDPESLADLDA